jgi:hypothetical protein
MHLSHSHLDPSRVKAFSQIHVFALAGGIVI